MKITGHEISVREIYDGYEDNDINGVVGYHGLLNIRPAFQREFIYEGKQRDEVIRTIIRGFPLNVMYWAVNEDGTYELIDGQQRTLSLCKYIAGDYVINGRGFSNLTKTECESIMNYKLIVYFCEGTDKEKLDWFQVINTKAQELRPQELRNAIYTGTWLKDTKKHFSKPLCPAYRMTVNKYQSGECLRQDYLEQALCWIADRDGCSIEDYMGRHQHDHNCEDLWGYYTAVMDWVKELFPVVRYSIMKTVEWGKLYNRYHEGTYEAAEMEARIKKLILDDDVTRKSGIYEYLLSGEEKHLNIRSFTESMRLAAYERQGGICPRCMAENRTDKRYAIEDMDADHITPWREGGKTSSANCQMLCRYHNRSKGAA